MSSRAQYIAALMILLSAYRTPRMPCGEQWRHTPRSPASSSSATMYPASSSPWLRGVPSSASSPCMGASWTTGCSTSAKARSLQLGTLPACGQHDYEPRPLQRPGALNCKEVGCSTCSPHFLLPDSQPSDHHHLEQDCQHAGTAQSVSMQMGCVHVCSTAGRTQSPLHGSMNCPLLHNWLMSKGVRS